MKYVYAELHINISQGVYLTDSTVVLLWIKNSSCICSQMVRKNWRANNVRRGDTIYERKPNR
jgi:hypothetical protein